jgi:hypothetical protein
MNALRVLIASGFGALIGSLTALELLPYLGIAAGLWPLCALLGGGIGYLAYDTKQLVQACQSALRATYGWRPYGLYWKAMYLATLAVSLLCMNMFVVGSVLIMLMVAVIPSEPIGYIVLFSGMSLMLGMAVSFMWIEHPRTNTNEDFLKGECIRATRLRRVCLPWCREYWFYALVRGIPSFARGIPVFVKHVVVFIHSDARTTCFTGGLLGTAVGVFVGSWLIGALAGAAIGLVSYELIGKRLLKTTSS